MTAPPPVADDHTVGDEDVLFRRVYDSGNANFVSIDQVTGERLPTSASFRVQEDEDGLSLYLESILVAAGLDATAVVAAPMNAVAAPTARAIRDVGLGVVRDPYPDDVPDPEHPRHCAHALAVGWVGGRKVRHRLSKQLAQAATLILDPGA